MLHLLLHLVLQEDSRLYSLVSTVRLIVMNKTVCACRCLFMVHLKTVQKKMLQHVKNDFNVFKTWRNQIQEVRGDMSHTHLLHYFHASRHLHSTPLSCFSWSGGYDVDVDLHCPTDIWWINYTGKTSNSTPYCKSPLKKCIQLFSQSVLLCFSNQDQHENN